jgi:Zn-dependent protease
MENIIAATAFIIPLIIAITLHEAAHGYVANMLGDNTAKRLGRVTLDPLRHVDAFGTILLPGFLLLSGAPFLFGYAKPMPVDWRNLRNPRWGGLLVALAGPTMNLLLAFLSALLLHIEIFVSPEQAPWTYMNIYRSISINILLAVFNMLPILPLDGGRIVNAVLPKSLANSYAKTERYGMIVILLLFMLPVFLRDAHVININLANLLIGIPSNALRDIILSLAGIGNNQ